MVPRVGIQTKMDVNGSLRGINQQKRVNMSQDFSTQSKNKRVCPG